MDASHDRDIELQRASGELIEEFRAKLPPLLWKHPNSGKRVVHRWARAAKVDKLILLLDPFQEWPQLLDPHLNWILTRLTDAFLSYLLGHGHSYGSVTKIKEPGMVYPLARAICKIIYTLCKVRGPKVISRFFSNEPKYLEPMLSMFIEWDTIVSTDINRSTRTGQGLPLNWEERYVMLLWLSHLLLAPFDLTSISSENTPIPYRNLSPFSELSSKAPKLALTILSISLKYLVLPGKEREGAILLLSRLALRKDMQQLGMLKSLIEWALRHLKPGLETTPPSTFTCIGLLSFIAKLATLSQVEDIAPFVRPIFSQALDLSRGSCDISATVQSSASTRKLLTKILREMNTLSLTLEKRPDLLQISSHEVSTILEDTIDYLLLAVGDKDTPVRFAASKALSMIALKLEPDLGADILDAVISALDEDVLYEEESGKLISKEKARSMVDKLVVRSFKSVDAQKWHGLMLTLGHLLFRRSPPLDRLSQLFECLVSGLTFEQRSSTGASIGVTVRDASCFGIWSLARKYSTRELESVEISPIENRNKYLLRSLAIELVSSACLDPSGNIRRGSSAALQELIGRHPDSISQGISIVQVVDYHSVARREFAMTEVAMAATKLDNVYWSPLIGGLLRWRGIGAPDPKSRRAAALAIGELSLQMAYAGIGTVLDRILHILSLTSSNSVEARHGGFLALSATVDAFLRYKSTKEDISEDPSPVIELSRQIHQLWGIFSSPMGPSVESLTLQEYRPDLTAEACSRLISSLARAYAVFGSDASRFGLQLDNGCLEKAVTILLLCVQRSEDETVAASSQAAVDMFAISSVERKPAIIQEWLKEVQSNRKKTTGRGQIAALGAVYRHSPSDEERKLILDELVRCSGPEEAVIVKRVSAVRFILTGVLPYLDNTDELESHIDVLLNDYTTDNRGDVGSLIRTEAINGVHMILVSRLRNPIGHSKVHNLIKHIIRLAAEKLDKVRFKAWKCFQVYWESDTSLPPLETRFYHFSEVSTAAYFTQLITLVQVEWLRLPLIKGLVTSLTAGADSLIISSRTAVVEFINSQNDNTRYCMQRDIFMSLLIVLEENITDDRYAIPTVESLAFFIENCFNPGILELDPDSIRKLFRLVQKFHFKSSNIPRIEAGLKAYYCLFNYELLRKNIVLKMTKMLLHPYPKIRALTSEYLFIQTGNKSLKTENWMQPPKQLKATVDNIVQAILS
ncbi:beta-tubulin cofactor d [Trichophyton tonsurans CBS 112818]|uniref:Beta-tubulin cofactor d n=1 Tax=Trichophyton tonsurans (strain CBS 112818) TaxID=647933 RepID=F2RYJ8_TRIT1|nr:beta-tubulin cofactor d [Trichophyton tonsurans CBS 112818]